MQKKKQISITKLAEHCGCSPATVSRVFNGKTPVNPEKRDRILRAAERFHYMPNLKAQRNTVALVISNQQRITPPRWFACSMVSTLLLHLAEHGYRATLCRIADVGKLNPKEIVAGMLIDWATSTSQLKLLSRLRFPFVCINLFLPGFNTVCVDHAGQMLTAVRYLLRAGHKRIVYIEPVGNNWASPERRRGALRAFEEAGLPYEDNFTAVYDPDMSLNREKFSRMLTERKPTAVICLHEDWILPLHQMLVDLGYHIGEDISLMTGELAGITDALTPGITAVKQDLDELAEAALRMIETLENNPPLMGGITHYTAPCRIVERNSVRKIL